MSAGRIQQCWPLLLLSSLGVQGCDSRGTGNGGAENEVVLPKLASDRADEAAAKATANDGPFGITMGQSLDDLRATETQAGWYELASVPKAHRNFPKVLVQATKSQGVCFVKGISDSFSSDSNGLAALAEANKIKRQLDSRYGTSREISYLVTGSIWNEPEDWMMAMLKGERGQAWEWVGPSPELQRQSLESVGLGITVNSTDQAALYVEYYFTNSKGCDAELDSREASAL